jgi:hypothetical protein
MDPKELVELMHTVLDGEATAIQRRALERQLASDPAARAEFDALRGLFSELEALPAAHPPEGLAAAVMAEVPTHQLSGPSRVIGATSNPPSDANTVRRPIRSWPSSGSGSMSEQKGSKRKIWIGAGLVALAAAIIVTSGIDFPPGGTSTSGAIVPAQRYRADQPATTGVGQTGQADAQRASQPETGNVGDARSDAARLNMQDGVRANMQDGARANMQDGARANMQDGARVNMQDGARVNMQDGARVNMQDGARVNMQDGARVNMQDGARVNRQDGARVNMQDGARVNMQDGARVNMQDGARVNMQDAARANMRDASRADGLKAP